MLHHLITFVGIQLLPVKKSFRIERYLAVKSNARCNVSNKHRALKLRCFMLDVRLNCAYVSYVLNLYCTATDVSLN